MKPAVAYYRTSSAANVGEDKDSLERQRRAVMACAASLGYEIVGEYYDAAVSGADPVDKRPGFRDMLERLLTNCARTVIAETANRFARDLIVQETGYRMLTDRGITLIAADSPDSFVSDTPTAVLIRQILGAVAQFDKSMTVGKLRSARDRRSAVLGKRCEGRHGAPREVIELAMAHGARGYSLRSISALLASHGYLSPNGQPYSPSSVQTMLR